MYKPKALDVDKMEKYISSLINSQTNLKYIEMAKIEAYNQGFNDAMDKCQSTLYCCNYEYMEDTDDDQTD